MKQKILNSIWHIIFWLTIVLTLIFLYLWLFEKELLKVWFENFKVFSEWLWAINLAIIFISSIFETIPILWGLFPGQNIMLIAWWIYSQTTFFGVVMFAAFWAIIWNYIWYFLWKYYGKQIIKKYGLYIWIWETELSYLNKWIEKYWSLAIIFSKFHPSLRSLIPFIAGIADMQSKRFWIYNIIWAFIRAFTFTLIWKIFVDNYELVIDNLWKIMMWLILVLCAYIYFFKKEEFKKYLYLKQKELENK